MSFRVFGMNRNGIPIKETIKDGFVGVIPFLISCLFNQQAKAISMIEP